MYIIYSTYCFVSTENGDGLCSALLKACPKPAPVMTDLSSTTQDEYEIPRSTLEFMEKLGAGMFGEVWKGRLCDIGCCLMKKTFLGLK